MTRWVLMLAALGTDIALAASGAWLAGECLLGGTALVLVVTKPTRRPRPEPKPIAAVKVHGLVLAQGLQRLAPPKDRRR